MKTIYPVIRFLVSVDGPACFDIADQNTWGKTAKNTESAELEGLTPWGPNGPWGPEGPFGPLGPWGPSGPFGPDVPWGPNGPYGPNGPITGGLCDCMCECPCECMCECPCECMCTCMCQCVCISAKDAGTELSTNQFKMFLSPLTWNNDFMLRKEQNGGLLFDKRNFKSYICNESAYLLLQVAQDSEGINLNDTAFFEQVLTEHYKEKPDGFGKLLSFFLWSCHKYGILKGEE